MKQMRKNKTITPETEETLKKIQLSHFLLLLIIVVWAFCTDKTLFSIFSYSTPSYSNRYH